VELDDLLWSACGRLDQERRVERFLNAACNLRFTLRL
jgi:hypothetical protein